MLYETILQSNIFLVMLYYGIWSGIIFEAKNLIEKSFKDNKNVCIVLDTAYMIICSLIFVKGKNMSNYGEMRMYLLIAFFVGIILEHISIGFLVEKIFMFVYNSVVKVFAKLKLLILKKFDKIAKQRQTKKQDKKSKAKQKSKTKLGEKKKWNNQEFGTS